MKTKRTATILPALLTLLLSREAKAFYNPSTGHWLSRDPIEERDQANCYSFVGNRTTHKVDRLGLAEYPKVPACSPCQWLGMKRVAGAQYVGKADVVESPDGNWLGDRVSCSCGVKYKVIAKTCTVRILINDLYQPTEKSGSSIHYSIWEHESLHIENFAEAFRQIKALYDEGAAWCICGDCDRHRKQYLFSMEMSIRSVENSRNLALHAYDYEALAEEKRAAKAKKEADEFEAKAKEAKQALDVCQATARGGKQ